ncbi:conserved hypothetical protein [Candidatus Zixiibacteriota bacterium]|nr:conserved hypothetical protein [candidate division Zixibacteria bacterium]
MTKKPQLKRTTATENRDLVRERHYATRGAFPEFLYHGAVVNILAGELYQAFPEYQFILQDSPSGAFKALGNCFPVNWDNSLSQLPDGGLEAMLQLAVQQYRDGTRPNILCAFQIIVPKELQGSGLSYEAVHAMLNIGREHKLTGLIAPVRPNRKAFHPEMPMEQYVHWKREDNLPADDWIRVHIRLGAELVRVCPRSFVVEGKISEWEEWTGMTFAESGDYPVPGALVPVHIDLDLNRGIYVEPNVWMYHRINI